MWLCKSVNIKLLIKLTLIQLDCQFNKLDVVKFSVCTVCTKITHTKGDQKCQVRDFLVK